MMKTVGEILKEKREEKTLAIKDVSLLTNISPSYIKAIENNDFSVIPGETYVMGFIRNYANFLGLDSNEIINKYKEYMRYEEDVPLELLISKQKRKIPFKLIINIALLVIIIGGIVYFIVADNPLKKWVINLFTPKEETATIIEENALSTNAEDKIFDDNKDELDTSVIDIEKIKSDALSNIKKANIEIVLRLIRPHMNYVISYLKDEEEDFIQKILAYNEDFHLYADEKIILKVTDARSMEIEIMNLENKKVINGKEYFNEMAGQIAYFEIKFDKNSSNIILNEKGMSIEQIVIPSKVIP